MAAVRRVWINPGVSGGLGDGTTQANAYASLGAAVTDNVANLVTDDEQLEFWCINTNDALDDTTVVSFGGYTTDTTHKIRVVVDPDYRSSDGGFTTGYRIIASVFGGNVVMAALPNLIIDGLRVYNSAAYGGASSEHVALRFYSHVNSYFVRCHLKATSTGGAGHGSYMSTGVPTFFACVASAIISAVRVNSYVDAIFYSNTFYSSWRGYERLLESSPVAGYSNVSVDCTDDYYAPGLAAWSSHNGGEEVIANIPGTSSLQHGGIGVDFEADGFTPSAGSAVLGAGYPTWDATTFTTGGWAMDDGWSVGNVDFLFNAFKYLDDRGMGAIDANSLSAGGFFRRGQAGMNGIGVGGPFFANPLG
jgi:hypothetical protein